MSYSENVNSHANLAIDGGWPVRTRPWPTYDKGSVFIRPNDKEAARRALESELYFRYDFRPFDQTECGIFETALCNYFGCKHALAVSSGTTAIALSLMAANLSKGAAVACPGFTFAATPSAILLAGCKPMLVECDADLNMDVDDLRRRWTPQIEAIVVVHMRGFASDMNAIMSFADDVGVPVIEDAVPALGVELNGRKVGNFGRAGCFSTQSDKSLNSGEGGFLITNDSDLFARAVVLSGAYERRVQRHFPTDRPPLLDDLDLPIFSFRMDEIRAALLRSELDHLSIRLERFKLNYNHVAAELANVPQIRIRQPVAQDAYLGEALIFFLESDAGWFADALSAEGIDARHLGSARDRNIRAFWNWSFMFDGFDKEAIKAELPKTARLLEQAVDIPVSSGLERADCEDLVAAVRKVAGALKNRKAA